MMNPQTILYALTVIGGVALAVYTTYKQYQEAYTYQNTNYSYSDCKDRRPKKRYIPKKTDDCVICLSTMEIGQLRILECKHMFHKRCLQDWINEKRECPICRTKFSK